jgi:A/G-specific adenine glycosylase
VPPLDSALLRTRLLRWYARHRRLLPWRGARPDAYRVWISEIMLQQTRVTAAAPFYQRFLQLFPEVTALAAADPGAVLAAWSGLGYYRRARHLHAAARAIVARHRGRVPLDAPSLRALPGIGDYTAAAIASIAGGRPHAAVDGNGLRIVRRLTARPLTLPQARQFWQAALSRRSPGNFNQALMDLGSLVCLPQAPRCPRCPLRALCRTRGAGPSVRRPAAQAVTEHYGLARRHGRIWLVQRPAHARQLAGLWELPPASPRAPLLATFRHSITTRRITAHVRLLAQPSGMGRWMSLRELGAAPLTGLTRKIVRALPHALPG